MACSTLNQSYATHWTAMLTSRSSLTFLTYAGTSSCGPALCRHATMRTEMKIPLGCGDLDRAMFLSRIKVFHCFLQKIMDSFILLMAFYRPYMNASTGPINVLSALIRRMILSIKVYDFSCLF